MTKPQTIQSLRKEVRRLRDGWNANVTRMHAQMQRQMTQTFKWRDLWQEQLDYTRKLEHMIATRELDRK